ncbi:MAG: orotate phosphoribosyltransferase [Oscillospiraceae bacterium]|nr:orotate phosphoribosyltransferase [Oscillospiraceae bacterium]
MENRTQKITAAQNRRVSFDVIPGHFATSNSHVSAYIDMNGIKSSFRAAKEAAKELATGIYGVIPVDTIICLEGTKMIGAFLAEELSEGLHGINSGNEIMVITPEFNTYNQIILRDNLQPMVRDKNVLLLASSVSSGKSIVQAAECLAYYGGKLMAAAAIFSDVDNIRGLKIHHIFGHDDIPEYSSYKQEECAMCKAGKKIDAIVNSFGYSKL